MGQLEAAIGSLLRKSVVKQGKQCAGTLMCIIPDRIQSGLFDGGVGGAEYVEKQAPDLTVGAFEFLHTPFSSGDFVVFGFGATGGNPCATGGDGADLALGCRSTDGSAEFHERDGSLGRSRGVEW